MIENEERRIEENVRFYFRLIFINSTEFSKNKFEIWSDLIEKLTFEKFNESLNYLIFLTRSNDVVCSLCDGDLFESLITTDWLAF